MTESVLPLPEYQFWYTAIRTDNFEEIQHTLNTEKDEAKMDLLNGAFEQDATLEETRDEISRRLVISRVWHLVVVLCSKKTIELFMDHKVNIFSKCESGSNVIHTMILAAAFQPNIEEEMMEKYKHLMSSLSKEDKSALLMEDNDQEMRPLEFAMQNSTTGLFQGEFSQLCQCSQKQFQSLQNNSVKWTLFQ